MRTFIHINALKENVWLYCFMLLSLFFLLSSCEKEGNFKYSAEYVKELYDKTFPVQDIDPAQDWKTTSVLKLNVSVYEDELEMYKIKVYDDFPLGTENKANQLAMGEVENGKTLQLAFDCPNAVDTVWVVRVDKANRREALVASAVNRNNAVDVNFGVKPNTSRSYTSDQGYKIDQIAAPYTQKEIDDMLATAVEAESGKAIGRWYGTLSKTNVYKLTKNGYDFNLAFDGAEQNCIFIVTTEWTTPSWGASANNGNLTVIIANGGKLKGSLTLTNQTNLLVMPGGIVEGGEIRITNASGSRLNYNGGTMNLEHLVIETSNGKFYNAATLKTNVYTASNSGTTFVNMGHCEIGRLENAVNSNIENGCYMKINEDCSFTNLVIGNGGSLICESFGKNQWGNMTTMIGQNAMINCNGTYYPRMKVYGPNDGKCLFKIGKVNTGDWVTPEEFVISNVKFEVKEYSSEENTLSKIMTNGSTVSRFGESNIYIPKGDCTGEGNAPGDGSDTETFKSLTYTYCYEDYYPMPGDYDFNDIVMDLSYTLTKVNNKVKSVEIPIQLTAVGATYSIGAALQLIGIDKSNIESATVTNPDLNFGKMFSDQATETGKNSYYIIPLYNDAHHAISGQTQYKYMYNTAKGHENLVDATPRKMTVKIVFKNALDYFGLENMDLFIARPLDGAYYEGQKDKTRVEIHLREFWEKRTVDGVNFLNNEAIAGNRTWAICVPDFKYPYENVPIYRIVGITTSTYIECAYPEFQQWASDRNTATQWYLHPNAGTTYR